VGELPFIVAPVTKWNVVEWIVLHDFNAFSFVCLLKIMREKFLVLNNKKVKIKFYFSSRLHVGKRSSNLELCCSHRHHDPVLANKHCVWRLKCR